MEKREQRIKAGRQNVSKTWFIWERYGYLISVLFLILCWLPEYLSLFPGAFSYDAYDEWQQVVSGYITAHHPVIHVLVLGYLVEWGHSLTGSYNAGIACYSILQMLLLANTFAFTVRFLHRRKLPIMAQLVILLFYGISPVVQMFSTCATKDTLFAASQLLFMLCLLHFCLEREQFFSDQATRISFILSALGTMILRNNGLYIVLIVLVIFLILSRERLRQAIWIAAAIAACYILYIGPFYRVLNVTSGGVEEMMSVPIQQLARVHKYDYDDLTVEDKRLLYQILPKEALDNYRSTVSDFVKKDFQRDAFSQNKYAFFKLWLKLGIKHPFVYVNSFLINTVDFWYPFAIIDGYQNGYANYFDYRVAEPGTYVEILPRVHMFYESLSFDKETQEKPFIFLLLSPGWYWVVFFVLFAYFWYRKQWWKLIVLSVPLLNTLTVLLGPMALARYVLILFYGAPLYITMALFAFLCPDKQDGREIASIKEN
ncbi:MAG: hypothetical protein K2K63_06435 [Acetatifactor sp.]|nr:hypothetical protein [Acetatifactor sp.]